MTAYDNAQVFGWRDVPLYPESYVPLRGAQAIPPLKFPEGYEAPSPSARPTPDIGRALSERIQQDRIELAQRVEQKLRELERLGLLDQVEGVDYVLDTNRGDPWSATLRVQIRFKPAAKEID
ncbi:hypothetical protein [Kineosporia babensis]|uniref:Uncharacterized protein n=1 Tax=Kineosporia babensis TaxID=499548 RepID=A0A9X1NBN7_9ACTN|nr:hypothetical protein [Kineosporia babensis]MCD5310816.1 hypothetical protein [Kineosporia babensis]